MDKINQFVLRHSKFISIGLLIVCVSMFFIPCVYFRDYWVQFNKTESSAFNIINHGMQFPQNIIDYNIMVVSLFLFFFISLWLLLLISIFISKKHPYFFLWSLLPLSVISIYCIYQVIGWATYYQPPHIGVFIYVAVLVFELLCFAALISKLVKKLPPRKARPHKPTKSERIAELEKQVAELQSKEKDAD